MLIDGLHDLTILHHHPGFIIPQSTDNYQNAVTSTNNWFYYLWFVSLSLPINRFLFLHFSWFEFSIYPRRFSPFIFNQALSSLRFVIEKRQIMNYVRFNTLWWWQAFPILPSALDGSHLIGNRMRMIATSDMLASRINYLPIIYWLDQLVNDDWLFLTAVAMKVYKSSLLYYYFIFFLLLLLLLWHLIFRKMKIKKYQKQFTMTSPSTPHFTRLRPKKKHFLNHNNKKNHEKNTETIALRTLNGKYGPHGQQQGLAIAPSLPFAPQFQLGFHHIGNNKQPRQQPQQRIPSGWQRG